MASASVPNPIPPPFFTSIPNFTPNPHASLIDEFNRLALQRKWPKKSPVRRYMWNLLIREEYERLVLSAREGTAAPQLGDWQKLCVELGVGGELGSIRQCKKALAKVHINLVDLIDSRRLGTTPRRFPNVHALIRYTRQTGKFVSREVAKKDVLIKVLLRRLR